MSTPFFSNSHKEAAPVLGNRSLTFNRKTKGLLKKHTHKKTSSEQNAQVLNRTQTCQAVCTVEFCRV